jgi:hypothetical protein
MFYVLTIRGKKSPASSSGPPAGKAGGMNCRNLSF